jgi:uncharacterized BrkB/YihY/UPF0761 family membrane protein
VPTLESALVDGTDKLPFGLSGIEEIGKVLLLGAALLISFGICSVIYVAVPKAPVPWRAVWPGALFVTLGAGLANWLFPLYLTNISSLSRFGSTLGFILIALLWFYLLSLGIMAGAVINSLRFEYHETGELPYASGAAPPPNPCAGLTEAERKKERERATAARSHRD